MTKTKSNAANVAKLGFWERNKRSNGYLLKKKAKAFTISLLRAILLFGMCFLILQPIFNKISISFMSEQDLYNPMIITVPEHLTLDNYELADKFMNYWKTLGNTVLISLTIAVLQIAISVSYTHLTLPTKRIVLISVVAVFFKKQNVNA